MTTPLAQALTLPCGLVLQNRIAKAALSEFMADGDGVPGDRLLSLYEVWGTSGAGLIVTGNAMVDRRYIEAPGNIILDRSSSVETKQRLAQIAEKARADGAAVFLQLGHAGAQTPEYVCERPVGPSMRRKASGGVGTFRSAPCRALTTDEIDDVIRRFVDGASSAHEAGFDGVQIMAAHGHLISQFLSPRTNQRRDKWGGTVENRSRLLLEIIREARQVLPSNFAISIKINVSDFVPGGLSFDDCISVVEWLNTEAVDLVELSGGVPVQPQMFGLTFPDFFAVDDRLCEGMSDHGAYFGEFSRQVRATASMPVMLSGGFRTVDAMSRSLAHGLTDMVALGRPMCERPRLPSEILSRKITDFSSSISTGFGPRGMIGPESGNRSIRNWYSEAMIAWHARLLQDISEDKPVQLNRGLIRALRELRKEAHRLASA